MISVDFDSVPYFLNLAAPYVSQQCGKELDKLMPYVDFFFSNCGEALAYANMKGYNVGKSNH